MRTSDYKNLTVWQKSIDFVLEIYQIIKTLPPEERYALSDQMRRSAISIPSNIAEGQSRNSDKDFIRFLNIANGSAAELETQLIICNRLGYIDKNNTEDLLSKLTLIGVMIRSLIKSIDTRYVF